MNACKVAAAGCALALGAEAVVGGSALATAGATLPVAAGVSELTVQACTGAAVICGVAGAEKPYDHLTSPPPTTLPQEGLGTGNGTEFLPGQSGEASSSSTTTPSMAPQAEANNTFASGHGGEAEGVAEIDVSTSRHGRREVMRKEGVPTSQQPDSQSKNESGRQYQYKVPKEGGGTKIKSVQQQTKDRSHPGEEHWEAGDVKLNKAGNIRTNRYGAPRLENSKSKVTYGN